MSTPTRDELLPKALEIAQRVLDGDKDVTPRQHDMSLAVLRGWTPKKTVKEADVDAPPSDALHIIVAEPEVLTPPEQAELAKHGRLARDA